MRKLASIRRINKIVEIEKADFLELAIIDSWQVVVKKGEFKQNDLVIYFEIDSWIPHKLAPFLSKDNKPNVYKNIEGEKLRTVKLKGQLSQGLVLPLNKSNFNEGDDLTDELGIIKWEPDEITNLFRPKGNFPEFLPKTDQERIQNVFKNFSLMYADHDFEVTMKLDGSSCTVYRNGDSFGICSRNKELKLEQDTTPFVIVGKRIIESLQKINRNIALQGELMGPKIQKNREMLQDYEFFVFNIWDIDNQCYLYSKERINLTKQLGLTHCPVYSEKMFVFKEFTSIEQLLHFADKPSISHKIVEGFVFKSNIDPNVSFKVINNKFLLKEK